MFRATVAMVWLSGFFAAGGCALFLGRGPDDRGLSLKRLNDYSITPPAHWLSIDRADSDAAFRLRSGNTSTVTSSCERDANQPLNLLTKHLLIGARRIHIQKQETIKVDGVEGMYSHVRAHLENKLFDLHLFVLSSRNCVVDFSLMSPTGVSADEVKEFKDFFGSYKHAAQ